MYANFPSLFGEVCFGSAANTCSLHFLLDLAILSTLCIVYCVPRIEVLYVSEYLHVLRFSSVNSLVSIYQVIVSAS